MSSHPIKYSTGNSWRAKQIWSKLQACWGLTCAALASAGILTLYCVRNSTWGTPAASTRKAWSIKEFLLALTNKKKSSSQTQIVLYSQRIHVWHIYNIYLLYIWIEFVVNAAINLPYFDSNGIGFKWYWASTSLWPTSMRALMFSMHLAACIPVRSESLLLLSTVNKAGRLQYRSRLP